MATRLLAQTPLELRHELVPAELLQSGAILGREVSLRQQLQPLRRDLSRQTRKMLDAAEVLAEGLIEAVEMRLVLHQTRACEIVERLDGVIADVLAQRFQQRQVFLGRYRELARLEVQEEIDQHGFSGPSFRSRRSRAPVEF